MNIQIDRLKNHTMNNRIEEIVSFLEENQFVFTILENNQTRIAFLIHKSEKYSEKRFPSVIESGLLKIFSDESIKISNPNDKNIGKNLTCHTSSFKKDAGEYSFTRTKAYPIIDEDLMDLYIRDDFGNIAHVAKTDLAQHHFGRWFLLA